MRSIRVSLLVYFLLLLVLALGAVSFLAYGMTSRSLDERQRSVEDLLRSRYEESKRQEAKKLDDTLLAETSKLAESVKLQFKPPFTRIPAICGLLGAGLNESGFCAAPAWTAQAVNGPYHWYINIMSLSPKFQDMILPVEHSHYFQINATTVTGTEWRSPSMESYPFPFDRERFARMLPGTIPHPRFDDAELKPGERLRRVTLKVVGFPIRREWPAKGQGKGAKGAAPFLAPPELILYFQGAAPTAGRDAALADLRGRYQQEKAEKATEATDSLYELRTHLLGIGLLTLAATLAGGFLLVRLGLLPLRRLTEAVSQVSEKDFRLPLSPEPLPEELRPIVARLRQTLEQLKLAFAREKQAAADISHELRTPLAALLATLDVALRKPRSAEDYRQVLVECRDTGQQMGVLVERLLTLARLDSGSDHYRPRPVDAAELTAKCAALLRPLAEVRGLTLAVHHDGPAELRTDPDKFREVLNNLLHNAIEYNRPAGRIDVAVGRQNGRLRLEVRDTGIGITPEARTHIFERFFRADPSRHSEGTHAGIGLAIVKGCVDLMGGTIRVDSTLGEGTTFTIDLPAGEH
jgi:heavy metal sensor kinase